MKSGPNSFDNFFSEPVHYPENGYVFKPTNQAMLFNSELAVEYFVNWLMDERGWLPRDNRKYVYYEVRKHITSGWVKWHGYINDNGETQNGWVLYHDWKGGQKRFRHVWVTNFEKHYIKNGHHFDPIISSHGMPHGDDCVVCGRLGLAKLEGQLEALNDAFSNTEEPRDEYPYYVDRKAELVKEISYYDGYK